MKELLSFDSLKYKKRLVRELNLQGKIDGFYAPICCHNVRCNRARLKDNEIQCHSFFTDAQWFTPSRLHFTDCYSREIVAKRT